jgi:hypothetical protein
LLFGELQLINFLCTLFAVQTIDFIVFFPVSKLGMDALMSLTDKFTKWVKLVPGKITYSVWDWAVTYYNHVYSQFGLSTIIILDRDAKFISDFWIAFFKRCGVRLVMITAYYPAADGQSERTN